MNDTPWTDEAIEALIRGFDGEDWKARVADINRDLPHWLIAGSITDERAKRLTAAIQARMDRTASAAKDKVELRRQGGQATGGAVGRIVMPMVNRMRPATAPQVVASNPELPQVAPVELPQDRPRRVARRPNRSPAERFRDRRVSKARERRRQAKLAKIPADLFQDYRGAEAAALSIIVCDIAAAASGQCLRTYKHIAASAAVCVRSVAEAVAVASHLGLIAVEHRKGKSSIITALDPELVGWLRLLDANRHPLPSDKIFENRREKRGPPSHAKACMTPSDRNDDSAQEAPPPPPARVGADRRPLPPVRPQANSMGIPNHGRIEASHWDTWAAIVGPRSAPGTS